MILGILSTNISSGYSDGYGELFAHRYSYFLAKGIEIKVLDINDFDLEKKCFTRYKDQSKDDFLLIDENVFPDVVWTRTSKDLDRYYLVLEGIVDVFPSRKIVSLACDKWDTYRYLSEVQPKTSLLSHVLVNLDLLSSFGKEIVIKPRLGYGGKDVEKIATENLLAYSENLDSSKYLVQELCDFSGGIEGICEGNHDIRLVYVSGKLIYSKVRTNEKNFKANISSGGIGMKVELDLIPEDLITLSNELISSKGFHTKESLLSLDFGFDMKSHQRKLIELNYSPGFVPFELHEYPSALESYYDSVVLLVT